MSGHPRGVMSIVTKIERILHAVDKKNSARRIHAIRTGFRARTQGKSDREVKRIALKCLHTVRNIVADDVVHSTPRDHMPVQHVPSMHSQLCNPIGPTDEEWKLACKILPGIEYASLRCRIARVHQHQHTSSNRVSDRTVVQNACAACGQTRIVYDEQTDDNICTQCGLARKAFHVPETYHDKYTHILHPMVSEPIEGHRHAQKKADYLSGMRCSNGISMYTKWLDYVAMTEHIRELCCKLHIGRAIGEMACNLYGIMRCATDRLERHSDVMVACIIVSRRCILQMH